jgi:hypothetical protein
MWSAAVHAFGARAREIVGEFETFEIGFAPKAYLFKRISVMETSST